MIDTASNILVPKDANKLIQISDKLDNSSISKDNSESLNKNNNSSATDIVRDYYRSINDTTQFSSLSQQKKDEENKEGVDETNKPLNDKKLTKEEKEKVKELKARDTEVKTHEQAHVNAGASNAQYEYEVGPDGARYAVGGNAQIDTAKAENPQATLSKAQKIKRAALAPANPSGQDRKVAAKAETMETEARNEIREESIESLDKTDDTEIDNQISKSTQTDSTIASSIKGYGNSKLNSSFVGNNVNIEA